MARKKKNESLDALDDFEAEAQSQSRRFPRSLAWILGTVGVLAAAYVGAAFYTQDKIPTGTTVLGVDIGGLTDGQAATKLDDVLAPRLAEPVTVAAAERTATLDPANAGLAVDYDATVENITGFSLHPANLWPHVVGSVPADPVVTVDAAALTRAVQDLVPDLEVEPADGSIDFSTGAPAITEPIDGVSIDPEASAEVVAEEWPAGEQPIQLVTEIVEPAISSDDLDAAMAEYVTPLLSGPVFIAVGETNHEITVEELAQSAILVPTDEGTLVLEIDGEMITERIVEDAPELGNPGRNARFVFEGGRPVVVPSQSGLGLEPEAVTEAVRAASLTDTRSSAVPLVEMEPDLTTEAAEALGVVEIVSEFSTPLTADNVRTANLIAGTAKTNGNLVRPGQTYSLLNVLRPITVANGFVSSGVVEGGVSTLAVGGGLSQLSTTVYNAAYFAGMDIIEHKPHSRWFSRYPEGRESTLWDPSVDLKFTNNTPHGILLQSWVSGGRVWVRAWSSPYFEVESYTSPRRNLTSPSVLTSSDPNCIPESGGQNGFTVDVTRTRYLNGSQFDRTTNTWTYAPWHRVICQ
ncbi:MAG TPA: VanW family protein [Actinomycetaceae bacterium]|nr:VanW family protein [Actinomycetaceae bacterium]